MAKHSGFLKKLAGKVHNVVGGTWNGIEYVRGMPAFSSNRRTSKKQSEQRAKFSLATEFFKKYSHIVDLTFQRVVGQTPRSLAFGNLMNAVSGTPDNLYIDYSKMLLAFGKLPVPEQASCSSTEAGKVQLNWSYNITIEERFASDSAILVAYEPQGGHFIFSMFSGRRDAGQAVLEVPAFSGKEVQVWLAFRSANEANLSRSLWVGAVTVL